MRLSIQEAIQPVLVFGNLPLLVITDLPRGALVSIPPDDKPGSIAQLAAPIPAGSILAAVPPEISPVMRPEIHKQKAQGAKVTFINVAGVQIVVYADMIKGGQPTVIDGLSPAGKVMRTHAVPAGAILVVLLPDLAAMVRPELNKALEAVRKAEAAGEANNRVIRP